MLAGPASPALAAPGKQLVLGGPIVKHLDPIRSLLFSVFCCACLAGGRGPERPTAFDPRPLPDVARAVDTAAAPRPQQEATLPASPERLSAVTDARSIRAGGPTAAGGVGRASGGVSASSPGGGAGGPPPSETPSRGPRPIGPATPPAPPPESGLTLEELQRMAAASNPTLRQAAALVEQARGNWLQVGLYPNPSVQAQRGPNNTHFDMFNVFVTQEIVTGGKLRLNRQVAARDVERASWAAEAQKLRVANEVRIRYVAALGAQRQVAVAEGLLEVSEQGVVISEQLLAGEEVSEADVLQARLQLNQTRIILRNARVRAAAAWKQLGNVVGEPDLPPRRLAGGLEVEIPELDWEVAWRHLVDRNPSLKAARARVEAARVQVARERKQVIPNLHLTAGLGRDYFQPEYMMYTLQLRITPPIFNRNRGNIAAANGDLRAAQSEVDRLALSLRDGLAEAFRRYRSSRNQARTYRETILPTAEANLTLSLKRYEEGEFDFLRVLTARRDLFDANIKYVAAFTEQRIAAIEIQGLLLTGGLDPVDSQPTPSNKAGETAGPGQ